jgi:hypothetical protein
VRLMLCGGSRNRYVFPEGFGAMKDGEKVWWTSDGVAG